MNLIGITLQGKAVLTTIYTAMVHNFGHTIAATTIDKVFYQYLHVWHSLRKSDIPPLQKKEENLNYVTYSPQVIF